MDSNGQTIDEGSYALEEDTNHFFYCCEKRLGPGQHAVRIYAEQQEKLEQRLNAALNAVVQEEDSETDDLFADEVKGNVDEKKQTDEASQHAAAVALGIRKTREGAALLRSTGYRSSPCEWG